MKYVSSINVPNNCWNRFGIEYAVWDKFMYFCFLSLFLMQPPTEKSLNLEITHEKKNWIHEIPTRKYCGPIKYSREKVSDPRNSHEKKSWTPKIPTLKNFRPMKYPRRHDSTIGTVPRRPTMPCDPPNLALSLQTSLREISQLSQQYRDEKRWRKAILALREIDCSSSIATMLMECTTWWNKKYMALHKKQYIYQYGDAAWKGEKKS